MSAPEPRPATYPQITFHRGYRYQDLVAAIVVARALLERVESVAIETARFQGDRFDDVVATRANGSVRIQVKHSASRVVLEEDRFDGGDDRLRIIDLVRGWEFDPDPLTALRVLATWASPTAEASAGFLVAAEAEPLTPTLRSTRWHLDANGIWPDGETPRWELLRDVSRESFLNFCERFTLELNAPAMSGSVGEPGPLERVLLEVLTDDLGVDRYPNDLDPAYAAARLIEFASSVRTRSGGERVLTPADVVRELGLTVDRGRVPQAFPLDRHRYVEAPLREQIDIELERASRLLVIGPPGAGKSWTLEAVAADLRQNGFIVARHYFFLEPGDPDVQQRVAIEVMSANLISELLDDSRLAGLQLGMAGDVVALGVALKRAAEHLHAIGEGARDGETTGAAERDPGAAAARGIVLIVDGVDHVARVVRDDAPQVRPDDVTAALATLDLEDGTRLIVGSQPGGFLDPLREVGVREIEAPEFDVATIA